MTPTRLTSTRIVLLFCTYLLVVLNLAFWQDFKGIVIAMPQTDWWLLLTMPFFLLACLNFIMQWLFWPYLHKVVLPLILVAAAAIAYSMMFLGVYFNADMLLNTLQTHPGEARALITGKWLLWVGITGIVPALLYIRYVRVAYAPRWYRELGWRVLSLLGSVVVVALIAAVCYPHYASFFRNHKNIVHRINPSNLLAAGIKVGNQYYQAHQPLQAIGLDAKRNPATPGARPKLFVLVVGETTRAENWGLNGYRPDTTPELAALNVINFPNTSSCGTATTISVPCMFSNMTRADYRPTLAQHQENLMDILQRAQLNVYWQENDGGCKGVCDRIPNEKTEQIAPKDLCNQGGCYDMAMLTGLSEKIDAIQGDSVFVLHTMGSHGPAYYERYPDQFKRFTPTCDSNEIQNCSREQLVNTYNNTVFYIDHMLAQTIKLLQSKPNVDTALLYVSDHGESLGEKNLYLHGAPYMIAPSQQTRIPMIFWQSPSFAQAQGLDAACLRQRAQQQAYSHDNLFHSMLGITGVSTQEYQPELDLFAACRPAKS